MEEQKEAFNTELIVKEVTGQDLPTVAAMKEMMVAQTQALTIMAESMKSISTFLNTGLSKTLHGYAKLQAVNSLLEGLASSDGRGSLSPGIAKQNALESVLAIEGFHDKYEEHLRAKHKGNFDSEVVDAESDFKKFVERARASQNRPE